MKAHCRKHTWLSWTLVLASLYPAYVRGDQKSIPETAPPRRLEAILSYIASSWGTLTRATNTCEGIADSKLVEASVMYLPADIKAPTDAHKPVRDCSAKVEHLPFVIHGPGEVAQHQIQPPGLLFLPDPYVVPGGRFNEMYGWDSYFIIRGLLRSGKTDLARGMVENFFYEIEHYGAVLNANRTYYLTRSQPPFLSSMIMAVYESDKAAGKDDRDWLKRAYSYAERDYEMWTHEPHLAGNTGLSRYYDFGDGPVPEGLHDEEGYYRDVLAYFLRQGNVTSYVIKADNPEALRHPEYRLELCPETGEPATPSCRLLQHVALTSEYYKGDRSMRESGFDISFRFGPYGSDTDHYAPVCLNSLLYKTETDLEKMSSILGDKQAASRWHERAEKRRKTVQSLLWDEKRGMFFDYNFRNNAISTYNYATTFYPLWTGIATEQRARAVEANLHLFEHVGGIAMSTQDTGVQWDLPYGWAPIQLLAVEGLRRYGYDQDANRISAEFLGMILANFERDGTIREKYNVVTDSSNIAVAEGYRDNVIGFGWTNGVFLELLHQLPSEWIGKIGNQPQSNH